MEAVSCLSSVWRSLHALLNSGECWDFVYRLKTCDQALAVVSSWIALLWSYHAALPPLDVCSLRPLLLFNPKTWLWDEFSTYTCLRVFRFWPNFDVDEKNYACQGRLCTTATTHAWHRILYLALVMIPSNHFSMSQIFHHAISCETGQLLILPGF